MTPELRMPHPKRPPAVVLSVLLVLLSCVAPAFGYKSSNDYWVCLRVQSDSTQKTYRVLNGVRTLVDSGYLGGVNTGGTSNLAQLSLKRHALAFTHNLNLSDVGDKGCAFNEPHLH